MSYKYGYKSPAGPQIFRGQCQSHNLSEFSRGVWHLRRDDENKVIWIDALCINQDDDEEKGIQVQMMDRIFQEAKRVAVWLGVGGGRDRAMDAIARFHDFQHPRSWAKETATTNEQVLQFIERLFLGRSDLSVRIMELKSLAERSYWRRVWIMQEYYLAQDSTIYYSQKSIPVEALTIFSLMLQTLGGGFLPEGFNTSQAPQEEIALCREGISAISQFVMSWHCMLRANRITHSLEQTEIACGIDVIDMRT
jgi:hypothetical protein